MTVPNWQHHSKKEKKRTLKPQALRQARKRRGQLYFWHDYELQLGKGDIIMFPSLFMYPHGVKEPTEGERFSGVCWAW